MSGRELTRSGRGPTMLRPMAGPNAQLHAATKSGAASIYLLIFNLFGIPSL